MNECNICMHVSSDMTHRPGRRASPLSRAETGTEIPMTEAAINTRCLANMTIRVGANELNPIWCRWYGQYAVLSGKFCKKGGRFRLCLTQKSCGRLASDGGTRAGGRPHNAPHFMLHCGHRLRITSLFCLSRYSDNTHCLGLSSIPTSCSPCTKQLCSQ